MKATFLLPVLLCASVALAQKNLPLIKASSKKAYILEGSDERHNWGLSPETRPDVHVITKNAKPKWISFYTDTDSIKVKLKPGGHFDFIVLLNGKDSCYTRLSSPAVKDFSGLRPEIHDTIPFELTAFNNIKMKAVLNKVDTLNLKFDSGTTGLLLTEEAIKTKTHLPGNDNEENTLQVGHQTWDSLRVYPVVLSGQGTDGRFGWDLFDGKIVEIDFDKSRFIVHSRLPHIGKGYSKFEMDYSHSSFCIYGDLQIKNKSYRNRFMFDNGYQRTIMLDTLLMAQQHFPRDLPVIKKVMMKTGQGKEFPVITVNNERLNLGKERLLNIPVQLLTAGNPARFTIHIMGNEVLKRFNTVLDFQNNVVYLKLNSLADLPYKERTRDLPETKPKAVSGVNSLKTRCMAKQHPINIKRAYEPAAPADGYRMLIDRLWPRGLKKEALKLDEWNKDIAPSNELRKWFAHVPERYKAFCKKYKTELQQQPEALDRLRELAEKGPLTLLYAAKDEAISHAVVLLDVLRER